MAGRGGMPPAAWSGVTEAAGTTEAVRRLLDAATAAADREDWSAAVSIAEAAASLDAGDPMVALALARARAGAAAEEPATGTRRRLTIMFCDLAGSTEIASALDPEDTREILHTYHATCAEIIRRYDGHIVHLMGDGALVSFGYPRAHEDDAARAVLAALSIAEAVPALRSPSTGEQWDLKVRVGIHTGLAVVEYLSGASWAQPGEIYGETPNLAARVQTAAAPGTVVISDTTYDMVRDRVDVRPLGPHTLKGIARPVELYEVHAVRADLDARREDPSNVAVVGRQSEREALDQAWEAARGAGAFAVICGEPGIGKSHLLRYVRDMVHSEGGRSVVLRCSALYSNTPLQPVVTLIRAQVDEAGADDPFAALVEVAGTFGLSGDEPLYLLAQLCSVPWPEGRTAPDLLPEQARERTLVMLMAWIDAMAARGPLLLAAEDVHWADPSTLDLLARCVTPERGQPILVVVTTRSDPATVPGDPATVLTLEPLGDTACHKLIDTLTGGRLDRATRALIAERGDGVPLYVRELAKMLDADGDPDAEPPPVPPSLNDLLVARLDSFPHARPVLDVLSVLGRPASPGLLGELTGRPAADLATDLAALERAGVVRASTSPTVVDFYHALLRDTAYDVQLLSDRRRLHLRVAGVLQARPDVDRVDTALELAHHWQLAGEPARAVTLWLHAAVRQAASAAHVEAIASFELVLAHLDDLGPERDEVELATRSGLAASLLAARGYTAPEVADAYARVRELSAARDARLELTSVYGLWSYYHVTGNAPASVELAETLLERARASGDEQAERAASAVLGYQLMRVGRPADALELLDRGRRWEATEPLFPHHAGIGATANSAITRWLLGDFAGARDAVDAAVAAADAMEGPTAHFTRAYTYLWAAELHQVAGRYDLAAFHAGRTVQVSAEYGFPSWLGAGMTELKIAEAMCGDDEALPVIDFCIQAWRDAGASAGLPQYVLGQTLAYRRAGRIDEACAAVDQGLADVGANEERYLEPELHRVRGELLCARDPAAGDGPEALVRALAEATANGSAALRLRALMALESRHRDRGDVDSTLSEVDELHRRLDPPGVDPEPTLVEARGLCDRSVAR